MTSGRILGLPNPALDANGEVISGATLTFLQSGTTTLQNIYAESSLTTPLDNPLVANSAGRYPDIWGDTSLTYTVSFADASGVIQQQYNTVIPTIGQAADVLLSNLTDNGVARTNIGLGTAAVEDSGTSGHVLVFADGNNDFSGANTFDTLPSVTASGAPLGYLGAPINEQDGTYALVLADRGKVVQHNSATPHSYTIPPVATVAWTLGDVVAFSNLGAGLLTLARGSGVTMYLHGSTTNGNLSIPQNGMASIFYAAANTWIASGDVS